MKRVVDAQACKPKTNFFCELETFFVETLIFPPKLPNVDIKPFIVLITRGLQIYVAIVTLFIGRVKLYILGTMNC